jgi:hypothetical protein
MNLLQMCQAAAAPDADARARAVLLRMFIAIENGDTEAAADAVVDALIIRCGTAMNKAGLPQAAATSIFDVHDVEKTGEPEELADEDDGEVEDPHVGDLVD